VLPGLAGAVRRRPALVLVVLALATVVLGGFARQKTVSVDPELFAVDSPVSDRQRIVDERFGGTAIQGRVQIVFDAGGGDVLSSEPIAAAARVERALLEDPAVRPSLAAVERPIVSFATPIVEGLRRNDLDPERAPDTAVNEVASVALAPGGPGSEALPLYSEDLDAASGRARGGLLLVELRPDLDELGRRAASLAVVDAIERTDTSGVRVLPFSRALLLETSSQATRGELPYLFGLGLAAITLILAINYRTVSDTLIGVVGLLMALTWMQGIAVLLGPRYLGWTGPFTAVSNVAPVVLLGLGIDDGIQLTARYREELAKGFEPARAVSYALIGVGGAIALTSFTTEVGFLVNLSSPIPPIGDFGVFTAVGSATSLVIMLTMPTAVRNLLDTRFPGRARRPIEPGARGISALLSRTAVASARAPLAVAAASVALVAVSLVAAVNIPTRFDRQDFLPEGSEVLAALLALEDLFGGEVNERTFLVVEGDLATPAAANALLAAETAIVDTPGVRSEPGAPAAESIAGLVAALAREDPALAARARPLGWAPEGFAPAADVRALYALAREVAPQRAAELVDAEGTAGVVRIATGAGPEGAKGLAIEIDRDAEVLRAAGLTAEVTSPLLVVAETNDALTVSGRNSIALALAASLALLVGYFWVKAGRPLLGILTMSAAVFVVGTVFGTLWLLGIPYNGLTVTIAAMAVGVGVTFSIHVAYRTLQELRGGTRIEDAVRRAVESTGAALASSVAATAAAYGVLPASKLVPIQQFGLVSALSIVWAFVAAVFVLPSFLILWGRRTQRRRGPGNRPRSADQALTEDLSAAPTS
jgi:predicted RND superfamily exporter protein